MTALESLDGAAVRRWCAVAAQALAGAAEQIDALNVFPVADADTGTNLHLTMLSGLRALDGLPASAGSERVWQALSHGVLLGAQGNSGVIVSQFLLGLAEVCGPAVPCDGGVVARGLSHAARLSRLAVGEPVDGTVLTVAAAGAAAAVAAGDVLAAVARAAAAGSREALARTTAQLDVLARHGVVDAGAAGLCLLFDALAAVVTGTVPEPFVVPAPPTRPVAAELSPGLAQAGHPAGYEVMYLLEASEDAVARLREVLRGLGDSLVVVGRGGLWNVHVHVADAGAAIEAGLAAGPPRRIRVTYLGTAARTGHVAGGAAPAGATMPGPAVPAGPGLPAGTVGLGGTASTASTASTVCAAGADGTAGLAGRRAVLALTTGAGIAALCASAGAVVVRHRGGQAPEPGYLAAVARQAALPSGQLVMLPGDARVTDVCMTVARRLRAEGIAVAVVPSQATVQCLAALAVHDPRRGFDDDATAMAEAANATRWGRVRMAGDAAAPADHEVTGPDATVTADATAADITATALDLAGQLLAPGGELVTLVIGAAAGPGAAAAAGGDIAARLAAQLAASRPDLEVSTHDGGEAGYLLLIGVE
jgi:DAK2 domain fusion protein YloV